MNAPKELEALAAEMEAAADWRFDGYEKSSHDDVLQEFAKKARALAAQLRQRESEAIGYIHEDGTAEPFQSDRHRRTVCADIEAGARDVTLYYTAPPDDVALRADAARYHELLCAVASKFPGETRHQTALRYITQRENQCNGPAALANAPEKKP